MTKPFLKDWLSAFCIIVAVFCAANFAASLFQLGFPADWGFVAVISGITGIILGFLVASLNAIPRKK